MYLNKANFDLEFWPDFIIGYLHLLAEATQDKIFKVINLQLQDYNHNFMFVVDMLHSACAIFP